MSSYDALGLPELLITVAVLLVVGGLFLLAAMHRGSRR
jgi:hypothetical protein